MRICFCSRDAEIVKKIDAIPEGLYFYPSKVVNNVKFGMGIFSEFSFDNSIRILRSNLFDWVKFVCDIAFVFQSHFLTDLEPIKDEPLKPFFIG
jgi:hypothetical protein